MTNEQLEEIRKYVAEFPASTDAELLSEIDRLRAECDFYSSNKISEAYKLQHKVVIECVTERDELRARYQHDMAAADKECMSLRTKVVHAERALLCAVTSGFLEKQMPDFVKECKKVLACIQGTKETQADSCVCGHLRSQHIYHDGACRPGFVCSQECSQFKLDPKE